MKFIKYLFYMAFIGTCIVSFYATIYELPPPKLNKFEKVILQNAS
jgi:hypothetical protein